MPDADNYSDALYRYRGIGASRADDAALMAGVCAYNIHRICGAVSSKLVWEGAQRRGMSTRDLIRLAAENPSAVAELQWEGTDAASS